MKKLLLLAPLVLIFVFQNPVLAQYEENPLPQHLTEEEKQRLDEIGRDFFITDPPEGDVQAIAEYEQKQEKPIPIYFMGSSGKVIHVKALLDILPLAFDNKFL